MFQGENEEVVEVEEENNEETHEETDTDTEGESEETKDEKPVETPEAKRARLKRQLAQLDKKHGFKDEVDTKEATSPDEVVRLRLEIKGVSHKKEQDVVMKYMQLNEVDMDEALKSPALKATLTELKDKRSVPAPSTRTGTRTNSDDPAYLVKLYESGKYLTADQMRKVRKYKRG